MNHVSLFSGIGGQSIACDWLGIETVGFCEIDAWNRRALAKHWPEAGYHDDIKTLTGSIVAGWTGERGLDLLTASWPCQPFSVAGKRRGRADDRYLWPEVVRILRETRPRQFLGENVAGLGPVEIDRVCADLEGLGFPVRPVVVPAGAVSALHRRERVWFLAHRADADTDGAAVSTDQHAWEEADLSQHRDSGSGMAGSSRARRTPAHDAVRPGRNTADAGRGAVGVVPDSDRAGRQERRIAVTNGTEQPAPQCLREAAADPDASPRGIRCGAPSWESGQHTLLGEGVSDTRGEVGIVGTGLCQGDASRERRGRPSDIGDESLSHPTDCRDRVQLTGLRAEPARRGGGLAIDEAPRPVDAGPDGVPAGLVRRPAAGSTEPDLIRAAWADGSWEADLPRVVSAEVDRRPKLRAAGNAIVSIVAYEILRVMTGATP